MPLLALFWLFALLTAGGHSVAGPSLAIDAGADNHPISAYIYGQNFAASGPAETQTFAHEIGLPVDRWGGNSTDRYNWQIGAWNTAADYYFENIADCTQWNACGSWAPSDRGYRRFVDGDRALGAKTLINLPLTGWVAKSARADHPFDCSYPKASFPNQDSFDYWDPNCGNGQLNGTKYTSDPATANVAEDPRTNAAFFSGWVSDLVSRYGAASNGGVLFYELGNEPGLWSSTHRDVHPQGLTYDELSQKSIAAAQAVKSADPSALTIGFSEWGWPNYFCGQADIDTAGWGACNTTHPTGPDAAAHANAPIVDWFLKAFREASQQQGKRLLDYLDVHYYNQAGSGDPTRSLWDPTYTDPSWIDDKIELIPRMKRWIAANYPGTMIALTEYNLSLPSAGAQMNALIQADTLGVFAREGVDLATRWSLEADGPLIPWAFRVFRNYDGSGARFGDTWVRSTSGDQGQLAIYAARQLNGGALTVVVINKTTDSLTSPLSVSGFALPASARAFRWSGEAKIDRLADQPVSGTGFTATYPARSITVFELASNVAPPPPPPP
ncbi:MAG: glycoside hydrolase family 44 protein, partial [Actinobacteria bacterium]|nr:glycoside hydrolase family 44 protein [Actinomycetota bacterium]